MCICVYKDNHSWDYFWISNCLAFVKHKCILIMYIFLFLYTARNVYLEHDTEKQLAMADAATAAIRMNRAVLARFDIAGESNVTSKNGCVFPSKLL